MQKQWKIPILKAEQRQHWEDPRLAKLRPQTNQTSEYVCNANKAWGKGTNPESNSTEEINHTLTLIRVSRKKTIWNNLSICTMKTSLKAPSLKNDGISITCQSSYTYSSCKGIWFLCNYLDLRKTAPSIQIKSTWGKRQETWIPNKLSYAGNWW